MVPVKGVASALLVAITRLLSPEVAAEVGAPYWVAKLCLAMLQVHGDIVGGEVNDAEQYNGLVSTLDAIVQGACAAEGGEWPWHRW